MWREDISQNCNKKAKRRLFDFPKQKIKRQKGYRTTFVLLVQLGFAQWCKFKHFPENSIDKKYQTEPKTQSKHSKYVATQSKPKDFEFS